jgi:hypothetical protein
MGWGGPNPPQEGRLPNEAMDVDDTPTSNPYRMAPLLSRRSPNHQGPWRECNNYKATTHSQGGGHTSTKGKDKAMTEATNRREAGEQTDQLTELLDRLSAADIDRSMTDFLEGEELTSLVIRQLLDHIDRLQADLVHEKKAQCSAEAQLVNTLRKRPASPPTNVPVGLEIQSIKKLRSDVGDGESISSFSDALRSIVQLHRFESHPASTDSASCMRGTAPSTQMKENLTKFKTEKRVERLLAPMVHKLPRSLPPTPVPLRAPGVAETPQLSSDDTGDMSDDDKPLTKGQLAEITRQKQIFQESRPGPIPDELGVVMIHQNYERDNFFRGTVAHHFYLSPRTNTVYSGVTAVATARAEYEGRDFVTPSNRRLYAVVQQGFPMNPREVCQLYKLILDCRANTLDHVEGFRLLNEFHEVTTCHHADLWDLSMKMVMDTLIIPKDIPIPFNSKHEVWNHPPIPRLLNGIFKGRRDKLPGTGLATPNHAQAFDVDAWARYLAYHGRPGHQSRYPGIMMDYGFRVYCPSLFRCLLGRAMSPPDQFGCHTFQRLFACLVAQPGLYTEKIDRWTAEHPTEPFQPCTGDTITITHLSLAPENVANMTLDDIISTLCNNCIPVEFLHLRTVVFE